MKVIIAGTRTFSDYDYLEEHVSETLRNYHDADIEIVSGGASGADFLGEQYAKKHNLPIKRFPADWNQYGRAAGPIRNRQMAEYADVCLVFWDGKSRGSENMITEGRKHCDTYVFLYNA